MLAYCLHLTQYFSLALGFLVRTWSVLSESRFLRELDHMAIDTNPSESLSGAPRAAPNEHKWKLHQVCSTKKDLLHNCSGIWKLNILSPQRSKIVYWLVNTLCDMLK
eukprot:TRINITY_DN17759_c0_g1_i1.p1 TRINITY_DN17759_c0_g1~~TRINITY_DN17759_c0_g1_i1.p1  ORF type:complete len:107 (+),score=7.98 TRINITY_DN17759_c0_g1_i1:555-875(+)